MTTKTQTVTIEVNGAEKSFPMTLYMGNEFANSLARKIVYEDMLKDFDFNKYPVSFNWLTLNAMQSYRDSVQGMITLDMTDFEERDAEWLKEYEKLDIDGMKSMMTCEKINNYSIDVNVRTCNTFEMIVMDSESGEIQAVFSDDEAMDDIPEFISIRSK